MDSTAFFPATHLLIGQGMFRKTNKMRPVIYLSAGRQRGIVLPSFFFNFFEPLVSKFKIYSHARYDYYQYLIRSIEVNNMDFDWSLL